MPTHDPQQFRTRLILQRKVNTDPDVSRAKQIWQDVRVTQAKLKPLPAVERFDTDQMTRIQRYQIVERWHADVDELDRWFDPLKQRYFQIESHVNVDELDEFAEMLCILWPQSKVTV